MKRKELDKMTSTLLYEDERETLNELVDKFLSQGVGEEEAIDKAISSMVDDTEREQKEIQDIINSED